MGAQRNEMGLHACTRRINFALVIRVCNYSRFTTAVLAYEEYTYSHNSNSAHDFLHRWFRWLGAGGDISIIGDGEYLQYFFKYFYQFKHITTDRYYGRYLFYDTTGDISNFYHRSNGYAV